MMTFIASRIFGKLADRRLEPGIVWYGTFGGFLLDVFIFVSVVQYVRLVP